MLMCRLSCPDGVREKDKNSLTVLLKHLGVFAPRDNSYTLCKHLYAEVQPAWPGYSDDDRALLKRYPPLPPPSPPHPLAP